MAREGFSKWNFSSKEELVYKQSSQSIATPLTFFFSSIYFLNSTNNFDINGTLSNLVLITTKTSNLLSITI